MPAWMRSSSLRSHRVLASPRSVPRSNRSNQMSRGLGSTAHDVIEHVELLIGELAQVDALHGRDRPALRPADLGRLPWPAVDAVEQALGGFRAALASGDYDRPALRRLRRALRRDFEPEVATALRVAVLLAADVPHAEVVRRLGVPARDASAARRRLARVAEALELA
jgi:hypothetical protein